MKATENFHKNDRTPTSKLQRRSVGNKQELTPEQTLDLELATALKVFFKDMKDVKGKVEDIKALGKWFRIHHVTSSLSNTPNKAKLLQNWKQNTCGRISFKCVYANN